MIKWITILLFLWSCPLCAQGILQDFFQGKKKVVIPFEYHGQFIIVDIVFQGYLPLKFIIDTGSEHTLLFDKTLVELFNIDFSRKIRIIGSDYTQNIEAYVARGVHLKIGNAPDRKKDIIVLQTDVFNLTRFAGVRIDGILGGAFFKNSVLEIDYKRHKIIIHDANRFQKEKLSNFQSFPIEIVRNKPYFTANCKMQNQDNKDVKLLLDSGAGLTLLLYADKRNNIQIPEQNIPGFLGYGLGGQLLGYLGRVEKLDFGNFPFDHLAANFQVLGDTLSRITHDRDGILGNRILERFHIIIDYVRSEIHIKPFKHWKREFSLDRSGLAVIAFGANLDKYVIQSIIIGSPAQRAGLKPGDVIKSIGRIPTYFYGLHGINKRFHGDPGKVLRLRIIRDGKAQTVMLRLEDLI